MRCSDCVFWPVLALVTVILSGMALARARSVPPTVAMPAPALAPTPTPTPKPSAIVFMGDGYTTDAPWPAEVGAALDRRVVNLAEKGTGYRAAPTACRAVTLCTSFRGAAARVAEERPVAVVIAGGEADGNTNLQADVTATLQELRTAVPEAKIVVLPPLSARSTQPSWLRRHAQAIQEAATETNVTWVDSTSVTGDSRAYSGGDLTEQAGKELAGLVTAELR